MANIPDRDEWEAFYAKGIAKQFQSVMTLISKHLGNPPDINNVPEEIWEELGAELRPFFITNGGKIASEAAQRMIAETAAIEIEWDIANEAAINWARQHSGNLVKDIIDFRRGALRDAVSSYFEDGLTIGQLQERIGEYYTPVRAEMIAVTEVTNASMQGEKVIVDELAKQGIIMAAFWNTSNDELVCDICRPRNGVEKGKGTGAAYWLIEMAAHPRCRCGISHRLPKVVRQ